MRTLSIDSILIAFALACAAGCGDSDANTTDSAGSTTTTSGASATDASAGTTDASAGTTDASASTGDPTTGSPVALEVQTYAAGPTGPMVNSHLVMGETEAILVDGQMFKADAEAVVAMVSASGRTLTTVLLTHAHVDHFASVKVITDAFPAAKLVSTQGVRDDFDISAQPSFDYLKMQLGDMIADGLVAPTPLDGASLTLDGLELPIVEMKHAGESKHAVALVLPEDKAILAGDLLYNNIHLVLAECAAQGWLDNLAEVKAMGFEKVYPGHGAAAGVEVFDADAQYIKDIDPILAAAATPDEAKAQIKAKYPTYQNDFVLGVSVDNYFKLCKG